ncbi:MAG: N-glycosylase/DNA lyase [Candidatus Cryosericum sp.]
MSNAFEAVCGDLAIRVEDRNETLDISFVAGHGGIERVLDFLDLEHDVIASADESLEFLCQRFPLRAGLLHAVFLYSRGTHILRQPILETVVGYLLSVQSTVSLTGRRLDAIARLFPSNRRSLAGRSRYLFPSADELRTLTPSTVAGLRLGYRSSWLLGLLARLDDEAALQSLQKVSSRERQAYFREFAGIGPKVAACIDLFAYGNDEAFPIDVWVDRGLRHVLQMTSTEINGVREHPVAMLGSHCGLFGEYLFRYERDHIVRPRVGCLSARPSPQVPRSSDRVE